MRNVVLAIPVLLFVAACDGAPGAAALDEVPAAFLGQWDGSFRDCQEGGVLALTVAPAELQFVDTHVAVTRVEPDGETAARVVGRFSTSSVDWDGSLRLELAKDGQELNVVDGAMLSPRVRCPQTG